MEVKYPFLFKMSVFSHFFKINVHGPRAVQLCLQFCHKFVLMGYVKDGRGRTHYRPIKVFATRVKDNTEFRFHIGQKELFLKFLDENYITPDMYEVENKPIHVPKPLRSRLQSHWVLKDYQEDVDGFIREENSDDNRSRLVCLRTGAGKAQPLDAAIRIPNGWSVMGNMRIGDIITARDGSPSKVIGVFPQGVKDIYRITFADGRSTECCHDHLWEVYLTNRKVKQIITTKEIISVLKQRSSRCYIDLIEPEAGQDKEFLLDPYTLGVFLGDGCLRNSGITLSTPDLFIFNEIKDKIPETIKVMQIKSSEIDYRFSRTLNGEPNPLTSIFKEMNLYGKYSYEKHIPVEYLEGSLKQRLSLIQGLLDTDGTVDEHGIVSYSTTSQDLAVGMRYLIRSIGGIAFISTRTPFYTHNDERREGRLAYQVNIRYKKPSDLFRLPRKRNRTNDSNQYAGTLKLRLKKIDYVGQKEAQCIAIDHPDHLYVTDEFIATHNTLTALASVSRIGHRTVILILPKYMEKWGEDITKTLDTKPKEIMMIKGSDQLKGLIGLARDQQLTSDFIVISLNTIQNFFKKYEERPNDTIQEYGCHPETLFELLEVGNMIIDEVHEHLHEVFKLLMYTHVPLLIALSATFISDDAMIQRIQHLMFPREIRFENVVNDPYIKVYAMYYAFKDLQKAKIRTTEFGSTNYSHNAFEKSIIRNKTTLAGYLDLIHYLVDLAYVRDYKTGDRLIIFASSIDMCTIIVNYLKTFYKEYDIRRYVESDPYENVIEADIRVTTPQSAGTAIDIPNLRATIMTINISSSKTNLQTLGRLRKLPDRDVKFYYIFCEQLKKHYEYHNKRMELFADRVLSIKELRSPVMV